MLTKEERAAIAERVLSFNEEYLCYADIYECLFGERPRYSALSEEYDKAIKSRILDLCDTSNMIELPVDKDGEVIHIGDTVYAGEREFTVDGFIFNDSNVIVRAIHTKLSALNFCKPGELTHKKPGAIESLVSEIRHVINRGEMTSWSMSKLFDISDQLEKLGDSDD